MQRDQAKQLMEKTIPNKNLQKHMLACEACMKSLAVRFGEDVRRGAWPGCCTTWITTRR